MFTSIRHLSFLLGLLFLLTACGGSSASANPAAGEQPAATGEELFAKNGCIACHAVTATDQTERLGPSLAGLAARAETTIQSAQYSGKATTIEAYTRESILQPQLYLVAGYNPLMPPTYESSLSQQELDILVDYLLTLE